MKKITWISALSVLAISVAAPVQAEEEIHPWYVGIGAGHTNWQGVCPDDVIKPDDCDDTDVGFDVFGGYRFDKNVGVELGYVDLGEGEWSNATGKRNVDANGIRLGLIGTLPLTERFGLNAELGGFYYDIEMDTNTVDADDTGIQPYVGAGAYYAFTKEWVLGAHYRHFRKMETDDNLFNQHSLNYWGLSLAYRFGAKVKAAPTPAPQPVAKPAPAPKPAPVVPPKPAVKAPAPSTVLYFDFNSYEVSGDELNKLNDIGRYMKANPEVSAELIGHTDAVGDPAYNEALGMRRATAVQMALLKFEGVEMDRVKILSKGESAVADQQSSRSERKVTVNLFGMK